MDREWTPQQRKRWWLGHYAKQALAAAVAVGGAFGVAHAVGITWDWQRRSENQREHREMMDEVKDRDAKLLSQITAKIDDMQSTLGTRIDNALLEAVRQSGRRGK